MENHVIYEIIGYLASTLIVISLLMSSIIKLRILNLTGAFAFTVYGYLIGSIPVALMNVIIVGINIYYLYVIYSAKEYFKMLEIDSGSEYLKHFLKFYQDEIEKFNPGFRYVESARQRIYFMLRNMIPAGLLIMETNEPEVAEVTLDFVIPGYRDFKTGKFIYHTKRSLFTAKGIRRIITRTDTIRHRIYLEKMGFEKSGSAGGVDLYMLNF